MEKIVLISCVSRKKNVPCKAEELYTSTLFKLNLKYAKKLKPKSIYILSALHGLVPLDKRITPYNKTLNDMPKREVQAWAKIVVDDLRELENIDSSMFIFLAGSKYRKFLVTGIRNYQIPLEGLTIGRQLKKLKELTS